MRHFFTFMLFIFSALIHAEGVFCEEYVDLHPFLDTSFKQANASIGCQPVFVEVSQQTVHEIYAVFQRGAYLHKICEVTGRWAEEFAALNSSPWKDTNYKFGIFDKGLATHKKSRLIQGINCKISREYFDWVKENHEDELASIPELEFLLHRLMEVEEICHDAILKKVEEVAKDFPQIERIYYEYRGQKRIPLSIRITRYDHTGKFCLPLHYDISVFSLIFPSDDDPSKECLIVASPDHFDLCNLRRPIRPIPTDASKLSTILIAGALMPHLGVPIDPSPHAVLPHHRSSRSVIVVCCHVPDTCTSDKSTVLDDMQSLPEDFKEKWGL